MYVNVFTAFLIKYADLLGYLLEGLATIRATQHHQRGLRLRP